MSTDNVLHAALFSALSGTAVTTLLGGTAVYYAIAPDEAALPYVVFSKVGGGPLNDNPHDDRAPLYWVRAYAETAALAGSVDAAVSTALHRGALTVTGYTNIWTARELELAGVELDDARQRTYYAGAYYRIRLTA